MSNAKTVVSALVLTALLGAATAIGAGLGGPGLTGGGAVSASSGTFSGTASASTFLATGTSGNGYGLNSTAAATHGMTFSGVSTLLRSNGASSTVFIGDGSTWHGQFSTGGLSYSGEADMAGTAGSGTGITVNATALVRHFVHKVTVAETALTAAATTQDITIWTVAAKTRIHRIIVADVTGFTGGSISAMTVMCGSSAGGNQYLLAGSIFASNAVLGDVVAEMGAGLVSATLADIPSMTTTTAISCRFTSTSANVVAATAGSATFYIEGSVYP